MAEVRTLAEVLDALTRPGELYERLPDGSVRCYACGHRCLIRPGRRGICQVRFNRDGTLYVPWGYVAALQVDPTEKKPFFHILPGSYTLTFGMLGCDLHCSYCFTGETVVVTQRGLFSLEELFHQALRVQANPDGEIGFLEGVYTFSHLGRLRKIRAVFRHRYEGDIIRINPALLPAIECTPDHRFLAIPRPRRGKIQEPEWIRAEQLSSDYCLVIPRSFEVCSGASTHELDVAMWLAQAVDLSRMRRGKGIRTLRGASMPAHADANRRAQLIRVEGNWVRVFNEHAPGIPARLPLNEALAELLGYYCAEGSVWEDDRRANSMMITFSFGPHEEELARRVLSLLRDLFGVEGTLHRRETTVAVVVYKSSLGLLLKALCGTCARNKRVPAPLLWAPEPVVRAFLEAYVAGDGTISRDGYVVVASVSPHLAYGIAWLLLRCGRFPSLRTYPTTQAPIQGRSVQRAQWLHRVRWRLHGQVRGCWMDERYYYIPIRRIERRPFSGYVFNLEVEEDHTYLPGFVAASNCQNWQVSQALRDEEAGVRPVSATPQQLVALAKRYGAQLVGSSYNEPLITSEWAVAIFKEAVAQGLRCVYVSNGNLTREVLEYLRPYLVGYKIDLKSMRDKNYRALGMPLKNVLEGIRMVYESGLWLEVVTLVVPGFNDSDEELRDAAEFLASISPDIPWHVTAFHPDYKMTDRDWTPAKTLIRAAEIGKAAGLRYVYAGNLPGRVGPFENTYCPNCDALLIARHGFRILVDHLSGRGTCYRCGTPIPGIWK
ncbi:radical SAM protein [Thermoflexus hugenholtzii]